MSRNIYEMFISEGLLDIFVAKKFTCGHMSGYSEYGFFEDDETEDYTFEMYVYETYADITTDKYDDYEIKGLTLYLYRNIDHKCTTCKNKEKMVYCDEQPKPVGFDKVTKYRGLNAYYAEGTYKDMIKKFQSMKNKPERQVCCSTNTIGSMGIVVEGDVLLASNIDLNTALDNKGRRYYMKTDRKQEHIIYNAKDLKKNNYNMNDELVMKNTKIIRLWLDIEADEESTKATLDIAMKYGYSIEIVNADIRM